MKRLIILALILTAFVSINITANKSEVKVATNEPDYPKIIKHVLKV